MRRFIVPALVLAAGLMLAGCSGGGSDKPTAGKSHSPTPSATASTPVNPGDGSGDGGADPENLNEGRKAGEAKVLWYKEAPDAPSVAYPYPGTPIAWSLRRTNGASAVPAARSASTPPT